MPDKKVDPAALMIAVIAVGIDPLLEEGHWHQMNTLVALIVLVAIWPYAITPLRGNVSSSPGEARAAGAVVSLIGGVLLAWPLQTFLGLVYRGVNDIIVECATWGSLGISAIIVFGVLLRGKVSVPERRVPPPARADESTGQ
jgi:hypothetical protein